VTATSHYLFIGLQFTEIKEKIGTAAKLYTLPTNIFCIKYCSTKKDSKLNLQCLVAELRYKLVAISFVSLSQRISDRINQLQKRMKVIKIYLSQRISDRIKHVKK
jgi:hypothetical protein